ncbi:MAG: hypothetical protein IT290_10435 [Deltaproteobacteria bacterium]|nr:hypothetical protein [Deltaproteobacteria bacterium]
MDRTSSSLLDESGNGGMRFLIILYALGILVIGLKPLKKYWAPYVQGATSGVRDYMHWGEPPKRGVPQIETEPPRLMVNPGKSRVQESPRAPATPPLDALTSKDKEELDGLLKAISPDAATPKTGAPKSGVSQGRKPEKPKVLSSNEES